MASVDPHSRQQFDQQPMSVVNTNQPRPHVRRATYIHVSDLTNAYNIDHARLEEELARVKEELENPVPETKNRSESLGSVPTELDTSYPQKRLQPPRGGNNMVVLVGKVRVVVNKNRVDGSRVRLAEVEVGDETGTVSLRARDEQIDMLEEISKNAGAVVLRNCTLELYQGKYVRVAVTKWGKMATYPDQVQSTPAPPTKINRDRNFSLINLSLVASELIQTQQQHHHHHGDHQFPDFDAASHQGTLGGRSFQSNASPSQRGRRTSHGSGPSTGSAPMQYADVARQYPGGTLHYPAGGFVNDRVGGPQYYPMRHQDSAQQQQMIMQYQFETQQRQMHMYGGTAAQQDSTQQLQRPALHQSPMVGIPGVQSFDASLSSSSASHTMVPSQGGAHPASPRMHPQSNATPPPPISPGGMNAEAASFDPSTFHRKPSS